jgi:hypothetical protein
VADNEQHRAALQELNRNYIRSVDEADVAWFDANLAADFFNTNPDGTFISTCPGSASGTDTAKANSANCAPATPTSRSKCDLSNFMSDAPNFHSTWLR